MIKMNRIMLDWQKTVHYWIKEKWILQEIAPHIFNNQYCLHSLTAESYALCYEKNAVIIKKKSDNTFDLPTFQVLAAENSNLYETATYLFSIDHQAFYLPEKVTLPEGFTWESLPKTMTLTPRHLAFASITGYQLFNWYQNKEYYGRCGTPLSKDETLHSLTRPSCHHQEYPNISPAVIIAVSNGNRFYWQTILTMTNTRC